MKFWLASSDLKLIEKMTDLGVVAGVVTNPAVVAEAKRDRVEFFREILKITDVAWYQLLNDSEEKMLADAETMVAIDPKKMRIKVPATRTGLGVISKLTDRA